MSTIGISEVIVVIKNLQGSTPKGMDGDGYGLLFEDLAALVEAQKAVMRAMARSLVELDLDRSC